MRVGITLDRRLERGRGALTGVSSRTTYRVGWSSRGGGVWWGGRRCRPLVVKRVHSRRMCHDLRGRKISMCVGITLDSRQNFHVCRHNARQETRASCVHRRQLLPGLPCGLVVPWRSGVAGAVDRASRGAYTPCVSDRTIWFKEPRVSSNFCTRASRSEWPVKSSSDKKSSTAVERAVKAAFAIVPGSRGVPLPNAMVGKSELNLKVVLGESLLNFVDANKGTSTINEG